MFSFSLSFAEVVAAPDSLPATGADAHIPDNLLKEGVMSATEKVKAKVEQLAGTVKKETGRAVGNDQTAAEGTADKVKGNLREAKEKVRGAFRD